MSLSGRKGVNELRIHEVLGKHTPYPIPVYMPDDICCRITGLAGNVRYV